MTLQSTPINSRTPLSNRQQPDLAGVAKVRPIPRDTPKTRVSRVLKTAQDDKKGLLVRLMSVPDPHDPALDAFEIVAKVKGRPEVRVLVKTRDKAEMMYELACLGITNVKTKLLDLPREFWKGRRELADRLLVVPGFIPGPDPDCSTCQETAKRDGVTIPTPVPAARRRTDGLPWWAGYDVPENWRK